MKQTQNTHACSLAGEQALAYSLAGEEAAVCSLACTRGKATAVTSLALGPGQKEPSKTVAKQNQLPSAGLDRQNQKISLHANFHVCFSFGSIIIHCLCC